MRALSALAVALVAGTSGCAAAPITLKLGTQVAVSEDYVVSTRSSAPRSDAATADYSQHIFAAIEFVEGVRIGSGSVGLTDIRRAQVTLDDDLQYLDRLNADIELALRPDGGMPTRSIQNLVLNNGATIYRALTFAQSDLRNEPDDVAFSDVLLSIAHPDAGAGRPGSAPVVAVDPLSDFDDLDSQRTGRNPHVDFLRAFQAFQRGDTASLLSGLRTVRQAINQVRSQKVVGEMRSGLARLVGSAYRTVEIHGVIACGARRVAIAKHASVQIAKLEPLPAEIESLPDRGDPDPFASDDARIRTPGTGEFVLLAPGELIELTFVTRVPISRPIDQLFIEATQTPGSAAEIALPPIKLTTSVLGDGVDLEVSDTLFRPTRLVPAR